MPNKSLHSIHRLTVAITIFTVIIVIGLLTIGKTGAKYKVSKTEMLSTILAANYMVSPEEAQEILSKKRTDVKFIDLRNKYDFNIGHIEGALNIPTHKLLEKENLSIFEDTTFTYVFYGANEIDGNGPWMVLTQMGYPNFKILQGSYETQLTGRGVLAGDKAMFDYSKILADTEKETFELQKAKDAPLVTQKVKKKKKRSLLKKVVTEAAEEEGC